MEDIKKTEYLLAEKAKQILEHQQELASLEEKKYQLQNEKPEASKEVFTYEESLDFAKKVKQYKQKIQLVELEIQKTIRELNALQLQAKKMIPVSEVKVRVSTKDSPCQTYCIEHIKGNGRSQSEENFHVERFEQKEVI
jgi:hypothetical protein